MFILAYHRLFSLAPARAINAQSLCRESAVPIHAADVRRPTAIPVHVVQHHLQLHRIFDHGGEVLLEGSLAAVEREAVKHGEVGVCCDHEFGYVDAHVKLPSSFLRS